MVRITRAVSYLSAGEVRWSMYLEACSLSRQRWLIMYQALVGPRAISEIARHGGSTIVLHDILE